MTALTFYKSASVNSNFDNFANLPDKHVHCKFGFKPAFNNHPQDDQLASNGIHRHRWSCNVSLEYFCLCHSLTVDYSLASGRRIHHDIIYDKNRFPLSTTSSSIHENALLVRQTYPEWEVRGWL